MRMLQLYTPATEFDAERNNLSTPLQQSIQSSEQQSTNAAISDTMAAVLAVGNVQSEKL
jgi:hypothetical protein